MDLLNQWLSEEEVALEQNFEMSLRNGLMTGVATAAIDKFYWEEDMSQAAMSGVAAGASTVATDYIAGSMGGMLSGRGGKLLVASALYTFAGPYVAESLNNRTPMERFFTSVAGHVGAGVVNRVAVIGTARQFSGSISAYTNVADDFTGGP